MSVPPVTDLLNEGTLLYKVLNNDEFPVIAVHIYDAMRGAVIRGDIENSYRVKALLLSVYVMSLTKLDYIKPSHYTRIGVSPGNSRLIVFRLCRDGVLDRYKLGHYHLTSKGQSVYNKITEDIKRLYLAHSQPIIPVSPR
mgnify:CR=1 FL=1